jgi:outer membrane immunogenic protein
MWQLTLLFDLMLCINLHVQLKKFCAALVISLTGISCAQASEFAGPYAGIKLGENWSDASGVINKPSHATFFPGLTAGYGFDVKQFVIGAEVFADFHHGSTAYRDAGVDLKVGMPFNTIMPYARLGMTGTWPNARLHGGLGVEYKFMKQLSVAAEWTADSNSREGAKLVTTASRSEFINTSDDLRLG